MTTDYVRALASEARSLVRRLAVDPLLGKIVRGTVSRTEYIHFLTCTFHYVRQSGDLLTACARGLERSGRCPMLVDLVVMKANEEASHDAWLLEDLRHLGLPAERVMSVPSTNAIQSYFFWNSMLAEAGSPGFLGAAYALEFVSAECAGQAAKNLRERSAIPNIENALSFLVGHAEADGGHVASLERELGSVTDSADQRDIRLSCRLLCASYPNFFAVARSDSAPRVASPTRPPSATAASYEGSRR